MGLLSLVPLVMIERGLNELLQLDDDSAARLQKLAGKRVRLQLEEFGRPLTAAIYEQQLVLSTADSDAVDCAIKTRLAVLPELKDAANITRLIKADALDIEGDPMLAQQFSQLFLQLDVDWEAQLASRIGDVPAHWLGRMFRQSQSWLQQQMADKKVWLQDTLIEEKKLLVGQTEFGIFKQELQQLRAQVDRLERRCKERGAS